MKRARCSFSRMATSTLPTGERWKRQRMTSDDEGDRRHERVVDGSARVEIDPADDGPMMPPSPSLAAGDRRPAEGDSIQHRRERQRQQREIDAAPAQNQRRRRRRRSRRPGRRRAATGSRNAPGKQLALGDRRRHRPQARTRRRGRTRRGRYSRPGCSSAMQAMAKMTTSVAEVIAKPDARAARTAAQRARARR